MTNKSCQALTFLSVLRTFLSLRQLFLARKKEGRVSTAFFRSFDCFFYPSQGRMR